MKSTTKITYMFFLLVTILTLLGCSPSKTDKIDSAEGVTSTLTPLQKKYKDYTQSFKAVTTEELSESKDNYFLYVGRITCPYCLAFVPKLYKTSSLPDNSEMTIKYLNSDDKSDNGLDKFIKDNDIEYVPYFSYYESGELVKVMDVTSATTVEEIQEFINNVK